MAFFAAIAYAAVIGALNEGGDRRVWLAELVETTNLIVLLWLLRMNHLRFGDLKDFVVLGHLLAAPFFAWYIFTKFGDYRLDFFFGLSSTLIPMTVAVILHQQLRPGMRALLAFSCLAMIVSTTAAGIRGTTLIALLASGLVILFSLRRFSVVSVLAAFAGGLVLVLIQPLLFEVATEVAPEAVERFRTVAESATLSVRLLEAQDAFQAFLDRPSGHGLGAVLVTRHELVYESTGITIAYGPTTFVHNSYAWYLAKTGLVGFLALVALIAPAVVFAARQLSTTQGSAALALATLLAVLVGAWGGPTLHNVFVTPWVAIALLLAYQPAELSEGTGIGDTPADRTAAELTRPPAHALRPGAR